MCPNENTQDNYDPNVVFERQRNGQPAFENEDEIEAHVDWEETIASPGIEENTGLSIDDWKAQRKRFHRAELHQQRENELAQWEVEVGLAIRNRFGNALLNQLIDAVENPEGEPACQRFLSDNPAFLSLCVGDYNWSYVVPKPHLGGAYEPDFFLAERRSNGFHWHGVELEAPSKSPVRQDGRPNDKLNQALSQVADWRRWLENNIDIARRPKADDGLGLVGIRSSLPATVIIGRRSDLDPLPETERARFEEFRREQADRLNIHIQTWDRLIEDAEQLAA